MKTPAVLFAFLLGASVVCALGANPYLHLPDDQPVTRELKGQEWDRDRLGSNGDGEAMRGSLTATATTQRLEKMPWGEIYRISFNVTPAESGWKIGPYHFLVTDSEILLLNSEDMDREIRAIREMKKQPRFEKTDVMALTKGSLKFTEGLWTTEVTIKGDTCFHRAWHNGSGHFGRLVWKRGVGLVEAASGRGADQTGYELKLLPAAKK